MLIRFIRGTALGGVGNDAQPGAVCDLPAAQARSLIKQGRAELVQESQAQAAEPSAPDTKRKPTRKA
jgi:hypothetical protein